MGTNVLKIRDANADDKKELARMRTLLFSGNIDEHLSELERYFLEQSIDIVEIFVIEQNQNKLCGFMELNIRNYAEGSVANEVPYIEAWFIDKDLRGKGLGKRLVKQAEKWAKKKGFDELASDAELENKKSIAVHKALGFKETDRIVCFLKKLD